jgi:hypothetical protein
MNERRIALHHRQVTALKVEAHPSMRGWALPPPDNHSRKKNIT